MKEMVRQTYLRGIHCWFNGGDRGRFGGVEEGWGWVRPSHGLPVGAHTHTTHSYVVARVRVKVSEGVGGLGAGVHLKHMNSGVQLNTEQSIMFINELVAG